MYFLGRGRKVWEVDEISSASVVYNESEFYDFVDLISSRVRLCMVEADVILEMNCSREEALQRFEEEGILEGEDYDL